MASLGSAGAVGSRRAAARGTMAPMTSTPAPSEVERPATHDAVVLDRPWLTVVWNDPVNLMSYVTYVFQTYFRYPTERAERLMLQVHHEGRAIVSDGTREAMERDVEAMHGFGLWATLQKADG
jgi:ATP-dependent Clp protease adaptor protein ClpS